MAAKLRYRMQSLKYGWGMEAEHTPEGKKELERARKENPDKYKYSRIYRVVQLQAGDIPLLTPFKLTVDGEPII